MNGQWRTMSGNMSGCYGYYLDGDREHNPGAVLIPPRESCTTSWALRTKWDEPGIITPARFDAADLLAAQAQAEAIIEFRIRERVAELQAVLGETSDIPFVEWAPGMYGSQLLYIDTADAGHVYLDWDAAVGDDEPTRWNWHSKAGDATGAPVADEAAAKRGLLDYLARHHASIAAGCRAEIERLRAQGEEAERERT